MAIDLESQTVSTPTAAPADAAPSATKQAALRIHYLDNLRAVAMLLGVFLHAGLAYSLPAQTVWLATDAQGSVVVDASIWLVHLFRMGLFFLLSGYFAKLVIERKGVRHFLLQRCKRILVPFVLFYPFLLAAMLFVLVFSLSYLEAPRGLMGLIASMANEAGAEAQSKPPGLMHLWFLYYLMAFAALSAVLVPIGPIRIDRWLQHPGWLCLAPLLLAPAAYAAGTPMPAPETFVPEGWPFAFYGLFYLAGWHLFGRESHLDSWSPRVWPIVGLCVAGYVPYYWLMPILNLSTIVGDGNIGDGETTSMWLRAVEAILTAYLSVLMTIACLLLGKRYLSVRSGWLGFVADSSYWVYLIHLPIVLFLQTLLIPLAWPLSIKVMVVIAGTFLPCMATYVVFVRYTPLGWLLHGKRAFP